MRASSLSAAPCCIRRCGGRATVSAFEQLLSAHGQRGRFTFGVRGILPLLRSSPFGCGSVGCAGTTEASNCGFRVVKKNIFGLSSRCCTGDGIGVRFSREWSKPPGRRGDGCINWLGWGGCKVSLGRGVAHLVNWAERRGCEPWRSSSLATLDLFGAASTSSED